MGWHVWLCYTNCAVPLGSPYCRIMCVYAKRQKYQSHIQKSRDYNVVSNGITFHSLCFLEPWQVCAAHGNTGNQSGERVSVRDAPITKAAKLFLWLDLARACFPPSFSFSRDGCFSLTQWCLAALISLAAVIKVSRYKSGAPPWSIGQIEVHPPWKDFIQCFQWLLISDQEHIQL